MAASLIAGLCAAGCGSSGRELRAAEPGATAPPRSTSSTAPAVASTATLAPSSAATGMVLSPIGWTPGGPLPAISSCSGEALSPPLSITGVPSGASELALVVVDPDTGGFVHWIVTGLAPTDLTLEVGATPPGVEGPNSGGGTGWYPLCPPPGELHTYELEVLAFDAMPALSAITDPVELVDALRAQATTRSLVQGTFER